jgi:thioredoxin-dependent peroxiredoxin
MLKVGDPAPDFTLTTHQGNRLTLGELRGRKVLIWFYPEADTPGWTAEGRGFRGQQSDFAENNIVVLGASFNTVEENAAFAKKNDFNFPLLCDTDRTLGLAYGACDSAKARYAKRLSILVDEEGKVARVYESVNPRDHAAQVLVDVLGL